jgi:hypothetical protein
MNVQAIAEFLGREVCFQPFKPELSGVLLKEEDRMVIGVNSAHASTRQIQRCEQLLEDFYSAVHARVMAHASGPDAAELAQALPPVHALSADLHAEDEPSALEVFAHRPTGPQSRRKTP